MVCYVRVVMFFFFFFFFGGGWIRRRRGVRGEGVIQVGKTTLQKERVGDSPPPPPPRLQQFYFLEEILQCTLASICPVGNFTTNKS